MKVHQEEREPYLLAVGLNPAFQKTLVFDDIKFGDVNRFLPPSVPFLSAHRLQKGAEGVSYGRRERAARSDSSEQDRCRVRMRCSFPWYHRSVLGIGPWLIVVFPSEGNEQEQGRFIHQHLKDRSIDQLVQWWGEIVSSLSNLSLFPQGPVIDQDVHNLTGHEDREDDRAY